jgi:hypothetical protein
MIQRVSTPSAQASHSAHVRVKALSSFVGPPPITVTGPMLLAVHVTILFTLRSGRSADA